MLALPKAFASVGFSWASRANNRVSRSKISTKAGQSSWPAAPSSSWAKACKQAKIRWVHADAFDYARQMLANKELFGAVVLDPPKFVNSRDDQDLARRKYNDLNALGVCLVEPGGLFVTCSCSGLLSVEDFEMLVIGAAHRHGRRLQILDRTGAGPDHPVMSNCPESRYLKVLWAIVR